MNCIFCNIYLHRRYKLNIGGNYYCRCCRSNQLYGDDNVLIKHDMVITYNDSICTYIGMNLDNKSILIINNKHHNFNYLLKLTPTNFSSKIKTIMAFL